MTKKLIALLLTVFLFAGATFAQTTGRSNEVKTVRLNIDGFLKSKSGAI